MIKSWILGSVVSMGLLTYDNYRAFKKISIDRIEIVMSLILSWFLVGLYVYFWIREKIL